MKLKHTYKYIFMIMLLFLLFAIYVQYAINENTAGLQQGEIEKSKQYAEKIADYIKKSACDKSLPLRTCLDKNPDLRNRLNHTLQAFQSNNFNNLFVIYKTDHESFRFLLDGSEIDKAAYDEPFTPDNNAFFELYKTHKPTIIEQKNNVKGIWLSLLQPINTKGETQAILVLDLSEQFGKSLQEFNSPLTYIVVLLQMLIIISALFLAYLFYNAYKLRKTLLFDNLTTAYSRLYRKEFFEENNISEYNLILIDIDKFKRINDRYGIKNANRILREFIVYIRSILPKDAKIIRNHGAEFLIVLPKSHQGFIALTHELFDSIFAKRYLAENQLVSFTISMSAIITPKETHSFYNIQQILDSKLLEIKSMGKNNLIILDDISISDIKYKDIDQVKSAIEEERLTCLYQPICETKTKAIVKYEALVRIIDNDDHAKLISPYYFMDLIKESIHYIRLSKWVIRDIFCKLTNNRNAEISFNIDLVDLYNEDMMDIIKKELSKNRKIADRLTFEILEHNEITDYIRVDAIFRQLKAYGSKIAIDDFGSGYANFAHLANLDIDIIKIDASIIKSLENPNNERPKSIIRLINDLGKVNNIEIIAEHVSSEEIYDALVELDVEFVQGFYLGKPAPWEKNDT